MGGVRTALYNYLFARRAGGDFIIRIEDTDSHRYVPGAEEYIFDALQWCGIRADEGVREGGPHGPYRQSERKEIYLQYALRLVESGNAYYAFDTPEALDALAGELAHYGKRVQLIYGGGSIKKNGIYDQVVSILKAAGKEIFEDPGVMPNPTTEKLYEGCKIARENNVDLLLAVGGGSCCDYAKGVSVSAWCDEDPWEKYYVRMEEPANRLIPVGCVLTMVGTGSEMNGGSVITNHATKQKIGHVFGEEVFPKFSILNPKYTYTLPKYQMVAGIYDIMNHITEQYFSGEDDCTSDYLMEGLMRSLLHSSRIAVKDPENYEARSNLMWIATWALNTLVAQGKDTDWMVHMIGQSVGAYTDATHGMTLSAVSLPYYRYVMPYGLHQFKKFAVNVWGVRPEGKTDEAIAQEGLAAMEDWMKEMGLVLHLAELGVTEDMLDGIAKGSFIMEGGYKVLTHQEIVDILRQSL